MADSDFRLWEDYGYSSAHWEHLGFPGISTGDTILHLAMRHFCLRTPDCFLERQAGIIRTLCELGARFGIKNDDGRTALDLLDNDGISAELREELATLARDFVEEERSDTVTTDEEKDDTV